MTAPRIKAGDYTTAGLWTFDSSNDWTSRYGKCSKKSKATAPLNINTSNVVSCNALCRLSINYKPTSCSISMVNNIPTVTFAPNCIIKFKNEFLYLRKMTIHYTSMHTINNSYFDLEIMLYHNRDLTSDDNGGIILSVLLNSGTDFGNANEFLNEFINKMPTAEMPIEKDVDVSSTWCPDQLFPNAKSYFFYEGALPYPPCSPKWTIIVFEETIPISLNIVNTVKYIVGLGNKNIRPIQKKPAGISIFYNANTNFDGVQDVSDSAVESATTPIATVQSISANASVSWLKQNIYYIKGLVITIILILMIYVAIKFAKVIVENDLLNQFIIKQLQKKQSKESQIAQDKMRKEQEAEYGGALPGIGSSEANMSMNTMTNMNTMNNSTMTSNTQDTTQQKLN